MAADVPARFFVDENDLALGRSLALARKDVLHPGHRRRPEVPLARRMLTGFRPSATSASWS